jgi:uncharacterized protein (UPF0261 family)
MSKRRERSPTVLLVGTLDTKGKEYAYLRDRIQERGVDVLLVDAGILGEPLTEADVTRREVAAAAGAEVQELADARDRGAALETMSRGAAEIVVRLHAEDRFDAIGALGGTGGTALATNAMRCAEPHGLHGGVGGHRGARGGRRGQQPGVRADEGRAAARARGRLTA